MMLKEIQVSPGEFFEIMGFTRLAAVGARVKSASAGLDVEAQLAGLFVHVEDLAHDFPGFCEAEAKSKEIICIHW
jgi:hypothetical protein